MARQTDLRQGELFQSATVAGAGSRSDGSLRATAKYIETMSTRRRNPSRRADNVIPFSASKRGGQPGNTEDKSKLEEETIVALSARIGPKHALLLHLLGYKTIQDLVSIHPVALMSIPGIGPKRFREIASLAHEMGFHIGRPKPERTGFREVCDQLAWHFKR